MLSHGKSFRVLSTRLIILVAIISCQSPHRKQSGDISELQSGAANRSPWTGIRSMEFEVPSPPHKGTSIYIADFEALHQWEEDRSEDDCERAMQQRYPTFRAFFGESGILSEEEIEHIEPFIEDVMQFSERVANYFKGKFERPRPFNKDTTLQPCAHQPSGNKSYPSSHATSATAAACILSRVYSDRSDEITKQGEYLSQLRVIVGVHHPSDVQAGQILGKKICERLQNDETFAVDLANVVGRESFPLFAFLAGATVV